MKPETKQTIISFAMLFLAFIFGLWFVAATCIAVCHLAGWI